MTTPTTGELAKALETCIADIELWILTYHRQSGSVETIEKARDALARYRASAQGAEPVAEIRDGELAWHIPRPDYFRPILPDGTLLYAGPAPKAKEWSPLPNGWTFNHTQQAIDSDGDPEPGTWEIGWLDPEDDRFSAILVLDTWLYNQEDAAEPLARAILERLAAPAAATEREM